MLCQGLYCTEVCVCVALTCAIQNGIISMDIVMSFDSLRSKGRDRGAVVETWTCFDHI